MTTDPGALASARAGLFIGTGPMAIHMRNRDWESTPLGPPEKWPHSLQSMVRTLLTSRYQMWMGWGPELAFFYNDAYSPTLGVKHPWALGQPAATVWKEIWGDVGPLVRHVMTTGEATYNEGMLLFLERSGFPEETYHTFSYSPLFDDGGNIAGMFCVVVEETERILAERRLATLSKLSANTAGIGSEAQFFEAVARQLDDNLRDLPFTLTYAIDEGRETARLVAASGIDASHPIAIPSLTLATSPWSVHGMQGGSVLTTNLDRLYSSLPMGAWKKPATDALVVPIGQRTGNEPAGFFIAGLNPYRPLDASYRNFIELTASQVGAGLAGVRALEQERKRAEALAEIDRAKTTFFSNVSHEFRTPLTLMMGPLESLLAQQTSSEVHSQAELAHRNCMRLLRLVNNLLEFSRIEAGRVSADYEPIDLGEFSSEIASSFRSAIERAGLTLRIEAARLVQPVYVDRDMWEKVLLNLLSNALKYTLEGGITLTIGVSVDGRRAELRVADTGIGIPEAELPRLFERFHRVEGAQGRSFEGTGIGLALVQELLKLHGGDISVASEPGQGSVFTVSLPFGSDHLPAARIRESSAQPAKVKAAPFIEEALRWLPAATRPLEAAANQTTIGTGKRVLFADDNADMREYVGRLLVNQGYDVETAGDGEEALEVARAGRFDLIVSDVMMPRLDGFGLLRAIRSEQPIADTPLILLSARAGNEATVEGLNAGADDYLIKPFTASELIARINTNVQMAKIRREAARAVMLSEQRFLMSQERLGRALSTGRIAVYEWNLDEDRLRIHGALAEAFGVSAAVASDGLPLQRFVDGIHPDDRERVMKQVQRNVGQNEPFDTEYRLLGGGQNRTVLSRGRVATLAGGERSFVGVLIDLTQEKEAEQRLRANEEMLLEQTRALQILNRVATLITGEKDIGRVVQAITDAGVELIGAQFGAFFYNVLDKAGDYYMLYTLSGAAPEAFSKFPMPRKTAVFGPTFDGTGIVRSDDITIDPRYGHNTPHRGMPPGHLPVRSYLAVPVRSAGGEVLGGLFFGHAKTKQFSPRAEELIIGLASTAAVAMDNARLIEAVQRELDQRRKAEADLQTLNATLEQRVLDEVAERTKAEEALRQAQKMEAVGQLTGGVAHDFNNLLTVIIGGLDTIRRSKPGDDARVKRAADMSLQGAQRAAHLTSRLLAFSRRQPLDPRPLDLNIMVRDMTELLHRSLGENIELEGILAPRLWVSEVDQNQLESAIINLAVNARDAMTEGGKLTIETANTTLDEKYAATDAEVIPGQYVMVAVSDTGTGMTPDVLARAFEPFFTTKEVGRGTGLGLSMVYGFVKQSGGHVTIYSEVGEGTTVKLYFPRYQGGTTAREVPTPTPVPSASDEEVVLVVEDNEEVRSYSVMILTELGYGVLEARDAESAIAILESAPRVDLLFTDVVLPGKTGRVLADLARERWPNLPVLYTTGYSRNAIVHHGRLDPGVHLITKPFTFEELGKRVRDLLDK